MKKYTLIFTALILCLRLTPTFAQFGRAPGSPDFDGATAKLFGVNSNFSATLAFKSVQPSGATITMPGKISFAAGKSRFAMKLTEAQGLAMPPSAMEHMQAMGMDSMISISRPDLKLVYVIYPGLHSYVAMTAPDASTATASADYKVETTELGKETVDGHDCVKNKVTVSDTTGSKHESTVWNATDLKNFPVKIVGGGPGRESTMLFQHVSFDAPGASDFEAPADFTKYENMQTMLRTEMMKKMGPGVAMPQGH